MTSSRKINTNRENARKSTGPSSVAGKQRAAQNARRHGLTGRIETEVVERWFHLIVAGTPFGNIDLPSAPGYREAVLLAEAEARLERIRAVESQGMINLEVAFADPGVRFQMSEEDLAGCDAPIRAFVSQTLALQESRLESQIASVALYARYRRRAEAQRHKALIWWVAALDAEEKTKRSQFASLG